MNWGWEGAHKYLIHNSISSNQLCFKAIPVSLSSEISWVLRANRLTSPQYLLPETVLVSSIFLSHYLQNGFLISQEFIVIFFPLLSSTAFESLYFFISLIAHLGEEKEKYEVKLPCLTRKSYCLPEYCCMSFSL